MALALAHPGEVVGAGEGPAGGGGELAEVLSARISCLIHFSPVGAERQVLTIGHK